MDQTLVFDHQEDSSAFVTPKGNGERELRWKRVSYRRNGADSMQLLVAGILDQRTWRREAKYRVIGHHHSITNKSSIIGRYLAEALGFNIRKGNALYVETIALRFDPSLDALQHGFYLILFLT